MNTWDRQLKKVDETRRRAQERNLVIDRSELNELPESPTSCMFEPTTFPDDYDELQQSYLDDRIEQSRENLIKINQQYEIMKATASRDQLQKMWRKLANHADRLRYFKNQHEIIDDYTGYGFEFVNPLLRRTFWRHNHGSKKEIKWMNKSEIMQNAILAAPPTPVSIWMFRGIGTSLPSTFSKLKIGTILRSQGFQSLTTSAKVAHQFGCINKVLVPKGSQLIKAPTEFEGEWIAPHGSLYRFLGRQYCPSSNKLTEKESSEEIEWSAATDTLDLIQEKRHPNCGPYVYVFEIITPKQDYKSAYTTKFWHDIPTNNNLSKRKMNEPVRTLSLQQQRAKQNLKRPHSDPPRLLKKQFYAKKQLRFAIPPPRDNTDKPRLRSPANYENLLPPS
jgi:hypothetical protein